MLKDDKKSDGALCYDQPGECLASLGLSCLGSPESKACS